MRDCNFEATETAINSLIAQHELYNLIRHKTCFKSKSGACIGLILTNKSKVFF